MKFYEQLDNKFENILSGICLTAFREENKKIASKHDKLEENNLLDVKNDFLKYIKNYLFLKDYKDIKLSEDSISAEYNGVTYEFFVDFDWGDESGSYKIKILDNGLKTGISKSEIKYVFIISLSKGNFILLNSESLKKQIKENRDQFQLITENKNLFKSQFVTFELSKLGQKVKTFYIK